MGRDRQSLKLEVVASFVVALALILSALVAGCGSSETTETVGTHAFEATEAAETTPQQPKSGPTEAQLEPIGDNTATGTARYLLKPGRTPVMRIEVEGLEPVSGPSRYAIWIVGNRHDMVNLAAFQARSDGRISRRIESPEAFDFVENGSKTELLVTKVGNIGKVGEEIAGSGDPWDPPIIGEPVVGGTFVGPFVGSASGFERPVG
jgi:hypothetical protein